MKSLKMRFLAFAAAASMLAGCSASVDANQINNNLKGAGYSTHLIASADYSNPAAFPDLGKADGLTYYLEASKDTSEALFAWFFDGTDNCSKWFEANTPKLVGKRIEGQEDYLGTTQHNNCVYVYTPNAKTAAKIS